MRLNIEAGEKIGKILSYKKNHKTIIKALVIVISEHFELFWYLYKQKSYGRLKYASFFKIDLEVQTLTGHISVTGGQRNLKFCIHWFLIRIYLCAKFEGNRRWWLPGGGRDQLNLTQKIFHNGWSNMTLYCYSFSFRFFW